MALFGFYSSCGELQSWLEEQTVLLQMLQPHTNNLEIMQSKYKVQPLEAKRGLECSVPPRLTPASL